MSLKESALAWLGERQALVVELFVLTNLSFLALDILLAHSVNAFGHWAEWVPFGFSLGGSLALALALLLRGRHPSGAALVILGVAWGAIGVGVAGLLFHLEGQFFVLQNLHSLVYSAPLAAPLAYAGLGFLLLLNRHERPGTQTWCAWLVFFALGGFVGNFLLALLDHAQNGFFLPSEWIPVAASAVAIGFLGLALFESARVYFRITLAVLAAQVLVGLAGLGLHLAAASAAPGQDALQRFIHGAPIFAPLLFANLALLGAYGVWCQQLALGQADPGAPGPQPTS